MVPGVLEQIVVGGIAVAVGSPSLTVADVTSPMLLGLAAGGLEDLGAGSHQVTVQASGMVSRRAVLRIADDEAAVVDAPPAFTHDPATDLVLTGANLAAAQDCVVWPDEGLAAPTEVRTLSVSAVGATGVTVLAAQLATLPGGRRTWRLSIRVGAQLYTPYVLVELAA